MALSIQRRSRARGAARHAWLLLCLAAALVAVVLWLRTREGREPSTVEGARELAVPQRTERVELAEPRAERVAERSAPPAEPTPVPAAIPAATPTSVVVGGARHPRRRERRRARGGGRHARAARAR